MTEDETRNKLEMYFSECEFNDECDECGNPDQEQSWAKMTGWEGEVDFYLCQSCAIEWINKFEEENEETTPHHEILGEYYR